MKTDKGQFDAVLRDMLQKPPQKTSEIRNPAKNRVDKKTKRSVQKSA